MSSKIYIVFDIKTLVVDRLVDGCMSAGSYTDKHDNLTYCNRTHPINTELLKKLKFSPELREELDSAIKEDVIKNYKRSKSMIEQLKRKIKVEEDNIKYHEKYNKDILDIS